MSRLPTVVTGLATIEAAGRPPIVVPRSSTVAKDISGNNYVIIVSKSFATFESRSAIVEAGRVAAGVLCVGLFFSLSLAVFLGTLVCTPVASLDGAVAKLAESVVRDMFLSTWVGVRGQDRDLDRSRTASHG